MSYAHSCLRHYSDFEMYNSNNLCLNVMLDSLSFSFAFISFLSNSVSRKIQKGMVFVPFNSEGNINNDPRAIFIN